MAHAPDLDIGGNRVRLEGSTYRITLALPGVSGEVDARRGGAAVDAAGVDPRRQRLGVRLRRAGAVGHARAALRIGGEPLVFDHAAGYHDHNWGFWEGVRWQWGQVAHDDVSIVVRPGVSARRRRRPGEDSRLSGGARRRRPAGILDQRGD